MNCRTGWIVVALASLGAAASAQASKMERFAFARIEALRVELVREFVRSDRETRARIARACAEAATGNPFEDIARALAVARGVECDAAFRLRSGLLTLALPEVLDPAAIDALHVTMHAPRVVPDAGEVEFGVRLFRQADDVVGGDSPVAEPLRTAAIRFKTGVEDLLRFRATTSLPLDDLANGSYHVAVESLVDGAASRATDERLVARVFVLRGFKARAEALPMLLDGSEQRRGAVLDLMKTVPPSRQDPFSRALLSAALWQVERVYSGDAPPYGVDPVADLVVAEAIFANLQAGRDALDGVSGRVTLGFPIEGEVDDVGTLVVDLPRAGTQGPLPLVVFVPGAPTWDRDGTRPLLPKTAAPHALAAQFLFGRGGDLEPRDHEFFVASIESLGRFSNGPQVIRSAMAFLRRVLPVRDAATVVVAERESAFALTRAAQMAPTEFAGLVLVAGAAPTGAEVEAIGAERILVVPAFEHGASPALRYAAEHHGVRAVADDAIPWPIAAGAVAPAIARFAAERAGVRAASDELATRVPLGFELLEFDGTDVRSAFALAQWLRDRGVAGAAVQRHGARGFHVVVGVDDDSAAVLRALRELPVPEFEPRLGPVLRTLSKPRAFVD